MHSNAPPTQPAPPFPSPSFLAVDNVNQVRKRIELLADRLVGVRPEEAQSGANAVTSGPAAGLIVQANIAAGEVIAHVDAINDALTRIESHIA